MLISNAFSFVLPDDNENYIKEDVNEILSSNEWLSFISSLSNMNQNQKQKSHISLVSILQEINKGLLDQNFPFYKYDPLILVYEFASEKSIPFLSHALSLCFHEKSPALAFVEALILNESKMLTQMSLSKQLATSHINLFASIVFRIGFIKQERDIILLLLSLGFNVVLDVIFSNLSQTTENYCENLMFQIYTYSKDFHMLKKHSDSAIFSRNEFALNFILDFLEKGNNKGFIYSDSFQVLFEDVTSQFLFNVLVSRVPVTDPSLVQIQIDILNQKYVTPLRSALTKMSPTKTVSDNQLKQFAREFENKKEIPNFLWQLAIMNRSVMTSEIGPSLERLAPSCPACLLLLNELKKQKTIAKPKENPILALRHKDGPFDEIVDKIEQSVINNQKFAADLLDSLNFCIYSRHKKDLKQFMSIIDSKLISRLSTKAQLHLSESVCNYFQTELSDQHLFTLSVLAAHLPSMPSIRNIFSHDSNSEVRLLSFIHDAAIASGQLIKLRETNYVQPYDENFQTQSVSSLDRIVMLRYQWRNIRGDAIGYVTSLPEYQNLITNDPKQFLEWELCEPLPIKRDEIIHNLNIKATNETLYILLKAKDVNEHCLDALIPMFSDFSGICVPSEPNMNVIAKFGHLIWNEKILANSYVQKSIMQCKKEISEAIYQNIPENAETYMEKYPSLLVCLLVNNSSFTFSHDVFVKAINCVNNGIDLHEKYSKYLVYSVSYVLFKENKEFPQSIEWKEAELFFSVCSKNFQRAFDILEAYPDLCNILLTGTIYEGILCGKSQFVVNLVRFAVFCSQLDISIISPLWIQFIKKTLLVSWPDDLSLDSENIVVFHNYLEKISSSV